MECLNCGEVLHQTPGKRERKYCNSTCRSNHFQKEKRKEAKMVIPAGIPDVKDMTPQQSAALEHALGRKDAGRRSVDDLIDWGMAIVETTREGHRHIPVDSDEARKILAGINATQAPNRSFRDYLDLVKAGGFDAEQLEEEVMRAPGLNANQRDMVLAKIRNA